jgi:hypothetical protein
LPKNRTIILHQIHFFYQEQIKFFTKSKYVL